MGDDPGAWQRDLAAAGAARAAAGLRRDLRPRQPGDTLVDLAGNDYLGLSRHPAVLAAAAGALHRYGLGATGSRLVRGSTDAHAELEQRLAGWLGTPAALVYSSGYLANLGAVRALAGPGTLLVSDAYNHASIVDGCRASRAEVRVAPHADVTAVAALLAGRPAGQRAVVVTESVFSVDGDLAPLRRAARRLPAARRAAAGRRRARRRRARPGRCRRGGRRRAGRRAGRGGHRDPVQVARGGRRRGGRPRVWSRPGRHRPHVHLRHRPAAGRGGRGAGRARRHRRRRRPARRAARPGQPDRQAAAGFPVVAYRRPGWCRSPRRRPGRRWPGRPSAGQPGRGRLLPATVHSGRLAPGCG